MRLLFCGGMETTETVCLIPRPLLSRFKGYLLNYNDYESDVFKPNPSDVWKLSSGILMLRDD